MQSGDLTADLQKGRGGDINGVNAAEQRPRTTVSVAARCFWSAAGSVSFARETSGGGDRDGT